MIRAVIDTNVIVSAMISLSGNEALLLHRDQHRAGKRPSLPGMRTSRSRIKKTVLSKNL
jgi:hypothetical protein